MSTAEDETKQEVSDAMEVEPTTEAEAMEEVKEEEEDVGSLADWMTQVGNDSLADDAKITLLKQILDDVEFMGPRALSIKEEALCELTRTYCKTDQYTDIVALVSTATPPFVSHVAKAKSGKLVRNVLDIACSLTSDLNLQAEICTSILEWCRAEKRTFLRHRVQAKLIAVRVAQQDDGAYGSTLKELVNPLLKELKQLDDKHLLVEVHLHECRLYFGLRHLSKAKAALTAARTCANAIYVSPLLQSQLDRQSGTLYCREGDYPTAHSYFLEAFEQLDQLSSSQKDDDNHESAQTCLKYMMLCRILDSLTHALALSAKGGVGASATKADTNLTSSSFANSSIITNRQSLKYAGRDLDAMQAIAAACSRRSLKELEKALGDYSTELQNDLLIKHHLAILQTKLLESNLIRIIEPYSCVEISHVAHLIEMPTDAVERKLSQMILDGKFQGILDQGNGQLIVHESIGIGNDEAMEMGLQVIANMDNIVTTLFDRSKKALRTF